MNASKATNARSSAATSHSGPQSKPRNDQSLTEAEFLRREAQRARVAITRSWTDAKSSLLHAGDPRAWAGEHPWFALTGAAAAGFAIAVALIPTKEEQAKKELAALQRALSGVDPTATDAADTECVTGEQSTEARVARRGWLGTIGLELIKALKPVLVSAVSAAVASKTTVEEVKSSDNPRPADGNGLGSHPGPATSDELDEIPPPS